MVVLNIGGLKMNRIIKWYRAIDEGKRLAFWFMFAMIAMFLMGFAEGYFA